MTSEEAVMEKLTEKSEGIRPRFCCEDCGSKDHLVLVTVSWSPELGGFKPCKKRLCPTCRKIYERPVKKSHRKKVKYHEQDSYVR